MREVIDYTERSNYASGPSRRRCSRRLFCSFLLYLGGLSWMRDYVVRDLPKQEWVLLREQISSRYI